MVSCFLGRLNVTDAEARDPTCRISNVTPTTYLDFVIQVYDNNFVRAVEAAITVHVVPQGKICGNSCEDGPCGIEK